MKYKILMIDDDAAIIPPKAPTQKRLPEGVQIIDDLAFIIGIAYNQFLIKQYQFEETEIAIVRKIVKKEVIKCIRKDGLESFFCSVCS